MIARLVVFAIMIAGCAHRDALGAAAIRIDSSCPAVAAIVAMPPAEPMPPPNMPLLQFLFAPRTAGQGLTGMHELDRCGWQQYGSFAVRYEGERGVSFIAKAPASSDCVQAMRTLEQWTGYLEEQRAPERIGDRCSWRDGAMRAVPDRALYEDANVLYELDTGLVAVERTQLSHSSLRSAGACK